MIVYGPFQIAHWMFQLVLLVLNWRLNCSGRAFGYPPGCVVPSAGTVQYGRLAVRIRGIDSTAVLIHVCFLGLYQIWHIVSRQFLYRPSHARGITVLLTESEGVCVCGLRKGAFQFTKPPNRHSLSRFERRINKLHPDDEKRDEFDYRWLITQIL